MYCKPGPRGCLGAACSWRRVHSGPAAKGVSLLHLQLLLPADRRNGVVRSRRLSIHLAAPGALLTRPDAWNSSPWKSCRLAGSSSKTLKNCHSSEIRLPNVVLRAFFFTPVCPVCQPWGKKSLPLMEISPLSCPLSGQWPHPQLDVPATLSSPAKHI